MLESIVMKTSNHNPTIKQPIIFIHIPKAAGQTLKLIINRQYKKSKIFSVDGANVDESVEIFKKLPEVRRREIRVLMGHINFGLHSYFLQPATYITMLRNPVDRIISHYYYVLRTPNHYLYNQVTSHNMTLDEYITSGISMEMHNGQTRLLAGINGNSQELLEVAQKNLQKQFACIGISERFDETLILLKRYFKWRNIFYAKINVAKTRPNKEDISKDTLDLIKKHNELDIYLYRIVKNEFEKIINNQDSSFVKELKTFQIFNKFYSKIYRGFYNITHPIKSMVRPMFLLK